MTSNYAVSSGDDDHCCNDNEGFEKQEKLEEEEEEGRGKADECKTTGIICMVSVLTTVL